MKKSLLIINKIQFGYHTDTYKYCQYLKDEFDITYICFDAKEPKINLEGIDIVYVTHQGSFFQKGMRFIKTSISYIKENKFDIIFIVYFQIVFLLGLILRSQNTILDIRTGAVWYNRRRRKIDDIIIQIESRFFQHVTIISECLRSRLRINKEKTHILPLGSDPFVMKKKQYTDLNLLYVGGLNNRNIPETIYGLKTFLTNNNVKINITYDIVGYGHEFEEEKLMIAIDKANLHNIVKFHGKVPYEELEPFFERSNVGVCYVPITDYFNCQPSTKMFEYINSGLVCIATMTDENTRLINNKNGLLCMDNSEAFANALIELNDKKQEYETETIRKTLEEFSWSKIVKNNLQPYLNELYND